MTTFVLALMFWGPLVVITGLLIWARARAKREGAWRWPAWCGLVLALILASTSAMGWLSLLHGFAERSAEARATLLARGIAESMNFIAYSTVILCLVTCAYYGYRFIFAKPHA